MKKFLFLISTLIFLFSCQSDSPSEKEVFTTLFDGETFTNWEGNLDFFRVEDGAIIAGSLTDTIPQNEFLCTKKPYGNFELKLEAKLIGEGQNAGVQFWSERIPDHNEVIGYQCDIGTMKSRPIWASLYDESRRRVFLLHPEVEKINTHLKSEDWNEITIRAEAANINFWLNGVPVLDYQETADTIASKGSICLQIHSGLPAEASYRDIRVREL